MDTGARRGDDLTQGMADLVVGVGHAQPPRRSSGRNMGRLLGDGREPIDGGDDRRVSGLIAREADHHLDRDVGVDGGEQAELGRGQALGQKHDDRPEIGQHARRGDNRVDRGGHQVLLVAEGRLEAFGHLAVDPDDVGGPG